MARSWTRRELLRTGACGMMGALALAAEPAGPAEAAGAKSKTLTVAWAKWAPSNYLNTLTRAFTRETGIHVRVVQTPWPRYPNLILGEVWERGDPTFDLIIGDSQWMGRGATENRYVDLTDWAANNVPLDDLTDSALNYYCRYNDRIVALPCEGDALGFAYRRDLFENTAEKSAFQNQYGYALAPPTTWTQFRDVAEFFTRPSRGLYGAALFYAGPGAYDQITMGVDQLLWSNGGELRNPNTGAVLGELNSAGNVASLEFYAKTLKQFTPPGIENLDFSQFPSLYQTGRVAMAQDWCTFFPDYLDRRRRFAKSTGFFSSPAGSNGHFVSLGGQGISLSAYSRRQDQAKTFLAWFSRADTQRQWAALGGLSVYQSVLKSETFLNAAPFHRMYAQSVPLLRDFYNLPRYAELLASTQLHWHNAVTGVETPQAAMDSVATEHNAILNG